MRKQLRKKYFKEFKREAIGLVVNLFVPVLNVWLPMNELNNIEFFAFNF